MTLIEYRRILSRYGYRARYSYVETASRDHLFVERAGYPISFAHSRKEIERMSPDDLEGQLIEEMFVVQ
jgi:hypothetical protein